MKDSSECVLLIDDSEAANVYHSAIIERLNFFNTTKAVKGGQEALDYLTNTTSKDYVKPDLILLDINMPGMSGWDFLNEYAKLGDMYKSGIIVFMLTTSLNQADRVKADEHELIKGFIRKPLTTKNLEELVQSFF